MNTKQVLTGYAIALLLYSAWRSWDYMSGSLVGVDQLTASIVALFFLAASELGLLFWLHKGRPGATTSAQEMSSALMIWFDFAGSMILGLADILKHNTLYAVDLTVLNPLLLLAPWVIIVGNVGGYLVYTMTDANDSLEAARRRRDHAKVQAQIDVEEEAIRQVVANKDAWAKELAPHIVKDISGEITGSTMRRLVRKVEKENKFASAEDIQKIAQASMDHINEARDNGHRNYNANVELDPKNASPRRE